MLLRESKEANLRFKVDAVFDAYGVLNVKHKRNDVGSMRMPQVHDEIGMKIRYLRIAASPALEAHAFDQAADRFAFGILRAWEQMSIVSK